MRIMRMINGKSEIFYEDITFAGYPAACPLFGTNFMTTP